MKTILFFLFFLIVPYLSFSQCSDEKFMDNCASLLDKYVFVKSFQIEKPKGDGTEFSYVLSKGTSYIITICDENIDGSRMVVELFDRNKKLIATNYNKKAKKYYDKIVYPCTATGVYYLRYSFDGGKASCGVSILGFSKN